MVKRMLSKVANRYVNVKNVKQDLASAKRIGKNVLHVKKHVRSAVRHGKRVLKKAVKGALRGAMKGAVQGAHEGVNT